MLLLASELRAFFLYQYIQSLITQSFSVYLHAIVWHANRTLDRLVKWVVCGKVPWPRLSTISDGAHVVFFVSIHAVSNQSKFSVYLQAIVKHNYRR
jgi:hypothetical protein